MLQLTVITLQPQLVINYKFTYRKNLCTHKISSIDDTKQACTVCSSSSKPTATRCFWISEWVCFETASRQNKNKSIMSVVCVYKIDWRMQSHSRAYANKNEKLESIKKWMGRGGGIWNENLWNLNVRIKKSIWCCMHTPARVVRLLGYAETSLLKHQTRIKRKISFSQVFFSSLLLFVRHKKIG